MVRVIKVTSLIISIGIVFISTIGVVASPVKSETLQEQLDRLEREIANLQGEKDSIQGQINNDSYVLNNYSVEVSKLHGEIEIYQKDIEGLTLQITQLEVNIELLNQNIAELETTIVKNEAAVLNLEEESSNRLESNYYNFRLYGGDFEPSNSLFDTDSINSYYKDSQYKELIQEDTNKLMAKLAELKAELIVQKADLEAKIIQVKKDKEAIAFKKEDLDSRKGELEVKIANYWAEIVAIQGRIEDSRGQIAVFSQNEAQKRAEAERVRNELFNSYTPVSGGEYVATGRIIGTQGCTGLCTGDHLHFSVQHNGAWQHPCVYLPAGAYGCGSGGPLGYPITANASFNSDYGNRCFDWGGSLYCDFHSGIDLGGPYQSPIFATHNGYAYKGVDPYGALYVIVCENQNCSGGIKTGYWHLSTF